HAVRPHALQEIAEETAPAVERIDRVALAVDQVVGHRMPGTEDVDAGIDEVLHPRGELKDPPAIIPDASRERGARLPVEFALGKPAGQPGVQRARARDVREQVLHLVGEHPPALEVDVFGVSRGERYGDELQAGLFRRSSTLVVVAAAAGGGDVVPGVATATGE